jgi:hypothetical protein
VASIGDALIYGVPFLILTVFVFGLANELYFIGMAVLVTEQFDHWDNFNGKCFVSVNKTESFCKSDFGFLGIKQWIDERDYEIINRLVSNNQTVAEQN